MEALLLASTLLYLLLFSKASLSPFISACVPSSEASLPSLALSISMAALSFVGHFSVLLEDFQLLHLMKDGANFY